MATMTTEALLRIRGLFEDRTFFYDSSTGKIYRQLKTKSEPIEFGSRHQRGYVNFWLVIDGVTYRTFAHRIIYYLHHGVWDDTKVINHLDGHKDNNRIENLELIYQFDNILYALRNREEIIHPAKLIDNTFKEKYRLSDEKWEIFKQVAYESFREFALELYGNSNHRAYIREYEHFEECKTIEEYFSYKRKRKPKKKASTEKGRG